MQWLTFRNAPYDEMLARQHSVFDSMVEQRRRGEVPQGECVMMVEHQPVYTLGRHGKATNLVSPEMLKSRGTQLVEIDRGGDITFHGPGQLVVYPIIDLQRRHLGVKAYVDLLEESVIRTIADYGIKGERVEGATGVWIDAGTPSERKICAIGIRCSRFISMHGLALNISTDLSWFGAINPCGFIDKGVTSILRETGTDPGFDAVATTLRSHLTTLLGCS